MRAELIARIEQATGRQARIDGPISISLLPTVHVSAGGIGLAGVTGDSEDFSVESVSFGVSLLPLLSGKVALNTITIVKPVLVYAIDENGGSNWASAAPAQAEPDPSKPQSMEDLIANAGEAAPEQAAQDTLAALDRIGIGKLAIRDGRFLYRDRRSGSEQALEAINLTIAAPDLAAGATVDGKFTWDGVEETVSLKLGRRPDPAQLAAVPVELTLSDKTAKLSATGTALNGAETFAGSLTASGDSLRALAERFGTALPDMPGYGRFETAVTLVVAANEVRVDDFSARFADAASFTGQAVIATNRPRPGVGLRLQAGTIDTAAFVPPASAGGDGAGGGNAGSGGETPIDFSALGLVDANVDFTAEAIQVGSVALAKLGLDLKLAGKVLEAGIREVTVNGAPGSGKLTIDARNATPALAGAVKMSGLDVGAVLNLAGVAAPVTGSGAVDVTFKTAGATQTALADNLEASGTISLAGGTVDGLNLASSFGGDKAANRIEDVDVSAAFTSLTSPVSAKGGLTWRGVRFNIDGKADIRALLAGETTDISVKAASQTVNLGFTGKAGMAGLGAGQVSVATPSLRNLLAWVGQPIGSGGGLQAFSLKGAVSLTADAVSFEKASFTLDKSSGLATGSVTFGKRPAVSAGLSMSVLDVTPYVAASGSPTGGVGGGGGAAAGGGWGDQPIAFDGLKAIDANLNLRADQIVADKLKIGATAMAVTLTGGKLTANLTDMALYSGKGAGTLTVDGSASTPAVAAKFNIAGVDALPFLTDAIGFSRVEGTGALSFDLTTSGKSQAALARGLSGNGAMEFRDGAIRGFNLATLKGLSLQTLLAGTLGTGDRTDFSRLAGTYTISKGVLSNQDLVLIGPALRATGAGTVDIGARTLAYRLEPKVVGSLQGQGATGDADGLSLPFRIEGSWDAPRFVPEFGNILANPGQAADQLKNVGGGLLNSLFGGGSQSQTPAPQQPATPAPQQPATPVAEQPTAPAPAQPDPPAAEQPAPPADQAPAPETTQPPAEQAPAPDAEQPPAEETPAPDAAEPATEATPPADATEAPAATEETPAEAAPDDGKAEEINPLDLLRMIAPKEAAPAGQ